MSFLHQVVAADTAPLMMSRELRGLALARQPEVEKGQGLLGTAPAVTAAGTVTVVSTVIAVSAVSSSGAVTGEEVTR
jgi:hypothetical protein